jgi:NAD(P)H-dependent flavin oxidoreductase YrpB (nitropropane dioxygenase family)
VNAARRLLERLRLPVVAAPMFLVSGPALVTPARAPAFLGTFPALNQRSTPGFADWTDEIAADLAREGGVPVRGQPDRPQDQSRGSRRICGSASSAACR